MKISTGCLKCKYFGHIQVECLSFPRKQRNIYNVTNYEKGESNQANNVLTFTTHIKNMKGLIYTSEPSNSKNMCVTPLQKIEYTISGNMSQHLVTHEYHFINFVSSIPLYCCKLYVGQPHHQQVWCDKSNILIHIACTSHKVFSCEDCYFNNSCTRHLIGEINYVTLGDNITRKKYVERKMTIVDTMVQNVEEHVQDIKDEILDTKTKIWNIKHGSTRNFVAEKGIFYMTDLKNEEGKIYDMCQDGKQTKMSYKIFQHLTHILNYHLSTL